MRKIDRTIPIHLWNPEDLEQLGKELEKALVTRRWQKQTKEKHRLLLSSFLKHMKKWIQNWQQYTRIGNWKNTEWTVFNKTELSEVQRPHFVEFLPQGTKLAADVESVWFFGKMVNLTIQSELGMIGCIWWGNFVSLTWCSFFCYRSNPSNGQVCTGSCWRNKESKEDSQR